MVPFAMAPPFMMFSFPENAAFPAERQEIMKRDPQKPDSSSLPVSENADGEGGENRNRIFDFRETERLSRKRGRQKKLSPAADAKRAWRSPQTSRLARPPGTAVMGTFRAFMASPGYTWIKKLNCKHAPSSKKNPRP